MGAEYEEEQMFPCTKRRCSTSEVAVYLLAVPPALDQGDNAASADWLSRFLRMIKRVISSSSSPAVPMSWDLQIRLAKSMG
jgi:hypothetical protein